MERFVRWFLIAIAAQVVGLALFSIAGCGAIGVPSPQTFNERAAASISTVTEVRQVATTLLQANRITVDDADNIQKQADVARNGIELARTLHASNPAAGENKLNAVVAVLATLRGYLTSKGG